MKEKNLDKKLNILVVCQYYTPEPFLINEIAPRLVQRGHQVTVLTGLPNYPEGIVPDEYRNGKLRDEMIEGVHVIRCEEVGRAGGKLNLLRNYFSYQQSATKKAKHLSGEFDLVLCYQLSPITMLAPAVAYKKKYNKPILTYCLDIWPESAQAHVPAKAVFKPIYQLVKAYSRKLYGECDRIVVTSEPFISYLHDVDGVSLEKMAYVPQHANGEMLDMDLSAEENGIADFMFAGNLGKGQKIETIVRAAAILKEKTQRFRVHIVGDGSMKESLEHLAEELNVSDKFVFYGRKSRAEMIEYYRKADALLITLRGNNFVGNTMPGKLQTYMTTGKPILGSINGAAMQVIHEAQCGKCVEAENETDFAEIMYDFVMHPENYDSCGENGRAYFRKHFTMDVFMDRLEGEMRKVIRECN